MLKFSIWKVIKILSKVRGKQTGLQNLLLELEVLRTKDLLKGLDLNNKS